MQPQDGHYQKLLGSIEAGSFQDYEIILVYDGWKPERSEKDEHYKLIEVINPEQKGPAFCRNLGAKSANGQYVCFCDSDTQHHLETLETAYHHLQKDALDGLIGCYDREPSCKTIVSQFRNLLHAYHHEKNHGQLGVFWGAFGIIKHEAFRAVGGFNASRYARPSIEDIELGYRLLNNGYTIKLQADVKIKHHKCWTLRNMLKTDLWSRAVPWTQLLNEEKNWNNAGLNTSPKEKLSAFLALAQALLLVMSPFFPTFFILFAIALVLQIVIQRSLYFYLAQFGKSRNLVSYYFLHQLYFKIAVFGFILGHLKTICLESKASQ